MEYLRFRLVEKSRENPVLFTRISGDSCFLCLIQEHIYDLVNVIPVKLSLR